MKDEIIGEKQVVEKVTILREQDSAVKDMNKIDRQNTERDIRVYIEVADSSLGKVDSIRCETSSYHQAFLCTCVRWRVWSD
jgi:hypothetical protein